ncbi:hypothetical protein BC781_101986 [Sediminitomix flava]|uniref:Uncharacterized protein n=2 Tax=Sediminitomix flava TaxID=379075 RepID=A0A315ZG96_SEDFL|nr:hypothetical protein BC781_101986 [Sediminitomix flava]
MIKVVKHDSFQNIDLPSNTSFINLTNKHKHTIMAKFNFNDVNVGDGVYFRLDGVQNFNSFWTVKSKLNGTKLEIEVDEIDGTKDKRYIDINDVIKVQPRK